MAEDDWAEHARITLDVAVHHALGMTADSIITTVRGHPTEVLLAAARGANLRVVGSRGHGPLRRKFTGSVSERIVSHSCCRS